jgi:hypothetical protein
LLLSDKLMKRANTAGGSVADSLEYARAGHSNAQEVIRFVDSKTSVITGIVTATTAIPLAIYHFLFSGDSNEGATIAAWVAEGGAPESLVIVAGLFLFLGFCFGVLSLLAATSGLMARRPRETLFKDDSLAKELALGLLRTVTFGKKGGFSSGPLQEVTCLFPLFKPAQREEAMEKFRKLGAAEYDSAEVLREYALQLESLGSILETKISRNRKAIRFFESQLGVYAVAVVLSVVLVFCFPPSSYPKERQWDPTLPGHARALPADEYHGRRIEHVAPIRCYG